MNVSQHSCLPVDDELGNKNKLSSDVSPSPSISYSLTRREERDSLACKRGMRFKNFPNLYNFEHKVRISLHIKYRKCGTNEKRVCFPLAVIEGYTRVEKEKFHHRVDGPFSRFPPFLRSFPQLLPDNGRKRIGPHE